MKKGSTEWYKMMASKLNAVTADMQQMRRTWYQQQMVFYFEHHNKMMNDFFKRSHDLYLQYIGRAIRKSKIPIIVDYIYKIDNK